LEHLDQLASLLTDDEDMQVGNPPKKKISPNDGYSLSPTSTSF
jgi:hypothetical protein